MLTVIYNRDRRGWIFYVGDLEVAFAATRMSALRLARELTEMTGAEFAEPKQWKRVT